MPLLSTLHAGSIWAERGLSIAWLSARLDVSDGRRARSKRGEFCALEAEVPPVDDLYASQVLGIGGTGGITLP